MTQELTFKMGIELNNVLFIDNSFQSLKPCVKWQGVSSFLFVYFLEICFYIQFAHVFRFWAIKLLMISGLLVGSFFIPKGNFSKGEYYVLDIEIRAYSYTMMS